MAEFSWSEEQRSIIQEAIATEIENSRLAHKLIPEFKIPPNARAVARNRYIYPNPAAAPPILEGIDETYVPLIPDDQSEVQFSLTKLQVEDDDLDLALVRIRRAAQQLARVHDDAVFGAAIRDDLNANAPAPGAGPVPGYHNIVPIEQDPAVVQGPPRYGDGLATATAEAVAALDDEGFRSGYVMIAGREVYRQLHSRVTGAAGLPIRSVKGLLEDGPVDRSAVLPPDEALILSISGEGIDRAVAIAPTLEFLRIGDNENRDFRLYERFLPRFKQTYAAVLLRLTPAPAAAAAPAAEEGD